MYQGFKFSSVFYGFVEIYFLITITGNFVDSVVMFVYRNSITKKVIDKIK